MPLSRREFTVSPTLATRGALLLVGRRTVAWEGYIFPLLFPFHRHTCHFTVRALFLRLFLSQHLSTPQAFRRISFFATANAPFAMAPRKPNPTSAKGPDPGRVDDDSTAFRGVSLVDDVELAKLVSSGALVEGQAFALGKTVVPKPVDNRTVVFAVFFEAGLRFPCNVLLPEILRLFEVELPQLSPSALVRIAIFDWACQTSGFEPNAELFGAIFFATVNSKMVITPAGTKKTVFRSVNFNVRPERSDLWPVNAAMSKWDRHWMARWFYHTIPFEVGFESAKALRCRRRAIAPNRRPKIAVDGTMEARFVLLRKVCSRLSCRDLVEEFCMLRILPLSQSWQVAVEQGEEVDGLPNLILPKGANSKTILLLYTIVLCYFALFDF